MALEKRLVVTRSDDSQNEMARITHPIIREYSDKCEADFMILSDNLGYKSSHYRILKLYDLFEEYDRILSLDTDILILKSCPNIFDVVPKDCIGTIFEDVGSRQQDRRNRIRMVQEKFGDVEWKSGYINTGVALFPRESRIIFGQKPENELWNGLGYDDVWLGYMIRKYKLEIFELDPIWNFMSMFSEPWNMNKSRFEAHIIHYAGAGAFHPQCKNRMEIMKEDFLTLRKYGFI